MNAVTKLAVAFAVTKGVQAVQKQGGVGAVLESLTKGSGAQSAGTQQAGGMGGLGDLLGQLGGGAGGAGAAGGLGDILGQLTGGSGAGAGALGGLGGLLGGLAQTRDGGSALGLEDLLNQDNPANEPDEEEVAALMLRAMIQAARADGDIDEAEKEKLFNVLREGDPEDMQAVKRIMQEPVDADALARDTPKGLETQVYTMSVNAINTDNKAEAEYLHALGQALGIRPETANQIHDSLGAPKLYR